MNAKRLFFILISCGIVYFICDKHLIPKFKGSYLDYSMTDLNQKPIKFDVYKEKYILVDVYATWCSDCLKSISGLKKIREIVVKEGWELVAISNDDTEKTKEFIVAQAKKNERFAVSNMSSFIDRFERLQRKKFKYDAAKLKSCTSIFGNM